MHQSIIAGEGHGAHATPPAITDLRHRDPRRAGTRPRRKACRVVPCARTLRARNERLGHTLTRLAASGHIARHGDAWFRVAVPAQIATVIITPRNGNGNGGASG